MAAILAQLLKRNRERKKNKLKWLNSSISNYELKEFHSGPFKVEMDNIWVIRRDNWVQIRR